MLLKTRDYPKTMLAWLIISALIIVGHSLLPGVFAYDYTAILLAVIGAIYIGFALQDSRPNIIVLELVGASFFVLLAVLGLWLNPYLWVLGLVLHGIWDWLHHDEGIRTKLPAYYPPLCVMVDWIVAIYLFFWLGFT